MQGETASAEAAPGATEAPVKATGASDLGSSPHDKPGAAAEEKGGAEITASAHMEHIVEGDASVPDENGDAADGS